MKNSIRLLAGAAGLLLASGAANAQLTFTTAAPAASFTGSHTENFNSLATAGETNTALPAGAAFRETGTTALTVDGEYRAFQTSMIVGDVYSLGTATDRSFGTQRTTQYSADLGMFFVNNTGAAINSLTVSYVGEMIWRGVTNSPLHDRLDFQFASGATGFDSLGWTDVDALDFVTPNIAGNMGTRNGNAAAYRTPLTATFAVSIAAGESFGLRWNDYDMVFQPGIQSYEDGLAIDDLTISAQTAPVPEPATWAMMIGGFGFVGGALRRRAKAGSVSLA